MKRIFIVGAIIAISAFNLLLFQNVSNEASAVKVASIFQQSMILNSFTGPSGISNEHTSKQSYYQSFYSMTGVAQLVKYDFNKDLSAVTDMTVVPMSHSGQVWASAMFNGKIYLSGFGKPARVMVYDPSSNGLEEACHTNVSEGLVKIWALGSTNDGNIFIGTSGENGTFHLYKYDTHSTSGNECQMVYKKNAVTDSDLDMIRNIAVVNNDVYLAFGTAKARKIIWKYADGLMYKDPFRKSWSDECDKIVFYANNFLTASCGSSVITIASEGMTNPLAINAELVTNNITSFFKYRISYSQDPAPEKLAEFQKIKLLSSNERVKLNVIPQQDETVIYQGGPADLFSLKALNDDLAIASTVLPGWIWQIDSANGRSKFIQNAGGGEVYSFGILNENQITTRPPQILMGGYSTCAMMNVLTLSATPESRGIDFFPEKNSNGCEKRGTWRPRQILKVGNKFYFASVDGYYRNSSYLSQYVHSSAPFTQKFWHERPRVNPTDESSGLFAPEGTWINSLAHFKNSEKGWSWVAGGTTTVSNQGVVRKASARPGIFFWNSKMDTLQANLGTMNPLMTREFIPLNFDRTVLGVQYITREVATLSQYGNRLVGVATLESHELVNGQFKFTGRFRNILFVSSAIQDSNGLSSLTFTSKDITSFTNFHFPYNSSAVYGDRLLLVSSKHVMKFDLSALINRNTLSGVVLHTSSGNKRIQSADFSTSSIWFSEGGDIFKVRL